MVFHRREIWRMDEDELVAAGRRMVDLEHSRLCHEELTSSDGKIKFSVPLERERIPDDVLKLSIKATAVK